MGFFKFLAGAIGAYIAVSLALWVWAFRTLPLSDEACAFGSVSSERYARLVEQAFDRDWTVWPGISEGLFWPSDALVRVPINTFEKDTEVFLLSETRTLAPAGDKFDDTLAAGHALMRSIGATFLNKHEVNALRREGEVSSKLLYYSYYIPSRRFSPLCLFCFLWPDSDINFRFDVVPGREPTLHEVIVRHSGLKYEPNHEPGPKARCPNE